MVDFNEEILSEFDLDHHHRYYDDLYSSQTSRSAELTVDLSLVKEEILDDNDDDYDYDSIPQEAHDLLQSSSYYPKEKRTTTNPEDDYSKCPKCQKTVKSTYINRHMKKFHLDPDRGYKCPEPNCDFVSSRTNTVIQHLRNVHQSKTPFICKDCPARFTNHLGLRQHNFEHVKNKKKSRKLEKKQLVKFVCEVPGCGKEYRKKQYLREHQRRHTGEKNYSCEFCGKRFYIYAHMTGHLYSHTGIKTHECRWKCGAIFGSHGGRVRHERITHYHDNPIHSECDICGRPFKDYQQLTKHRITHMSPEERKEFRCSICYITFGTIELRENHEERHRSEEKIECSVCKTLFRNDKGLRNHCKRHHPNALDPCHLCEPPSKLFTPVTLRRHISRVHHKTSYKCPREECERGFKEKNSLEAHMEVHRRRECRICGKKFDEKRKADIHLLRVHKLGKDDLKDLGRWQPRILLDKLPSCTLRKWLKNVKEE